MITPETTDPATIEAPELAVGAMLTTVEELASLPNNALIVVFRDPGVTRYPRVFIKAGDRDNGQWVELDPADRSDGETTISSLGVLLHYANRSCQLVWLPELNSHR